MKNFATNKNWCQCYCSLCEKFDPQKGETRSKLIEM